MSFYIDKKEINTLPNGNKIIIYSFDDESYKPIISKAKAVNTTLEDESFCDKYGFKVGQIKLYGESDVWSCWGKISNDKYNEHCETLEKLFQSILPRPKIVKNPITNIIHDSYTCYCCKEFNIEDVLYHTTAFESWRCLITKLGNPKYAIVIEQYK